MEYKADKRIVKGCIEYLKNKKPSEIYPDLRKHLVDTYIWVEEIFSVDPEIRVDS